MNSKKLSSIIVLFLFISIAFGQTAMALTNSDRGLIVDLLNQNPDPVKPGDILEIRFSVQNTRSSTTDNVVVELVPKYPFSKVSGQPIIENIGKLGKRYEDENSKVVKFELLVDNNVNAGQYPLEVLVYEQGNRDHASLKQEVMIDIDSESNAEIESISLEKLVPGKKTNLSFVIKNVGNSPLKNAMFSWESTSDLILPVGSSNVKYINFIDIGENATVEYQVLTNVNTKPGLYKLDMTLVYDDVEELQTITQAGTLENQKRKTIESKAGIYIGGTTDFDIVFVEQTQRGDYSFSVSNIGNNKASSVTISIPDQEGWNVNGGSNSVVLGSLQKGDYTIADFGITPDTYGEFLPLKFQIAYTSSDGEREVQDKELSVLASKPVLIQESAKSSGSKSWVVLAFAVACVAGFVFYKKKKL
ncbi:COG1361 S-layer family protein [Methanococcoides methylutens]|uniref:NPCBM-associated, NEW3 domain of alpha-galactosidase n=1 Tax=Methanococcoides methylutens MM1 TaxID=1434104 RepID=A0A0E3SS86_METMT|nr:COG1361 S-layer family protein [Methanococcoides methylutens]AKB85343.1 NPCBM-associated, NEW3 domain of alpha-galactosidase [Methanococcoides methylutens MM1]